MSTGGVVVRNEVLTVHVGVLRVGLLAVGCWGCVLGLRAGVACWGCVLGLRAGVAVLGVLLDLGLFSVGMLGVEVRGGGGGGSHDGSAGGGVLGV